MEQHYKYDFSVVMSVYNVEQFLREAVASLEHQRIGFSRIQLIMVDDGSSDGSGAICDTYGKKYPDNVIVVHKKNGGLSSSRNTGLPLVKGKYISFLDPDDTLPPDTFQKVFSFMENHPEVDISCIPLYYFGNSTGPHNLNYKFSQGTRVIDLSRDENADQILLSAASSFYRSNVASKMSFDTELYTAEDAKENLRLLMDNPRLGLIADARYNYRKHGNSIVDKKRITPAWYLTYLQHFSKCVLDAAEQRFGFIPKFIQYTVMYDLQPKLQQPHIPVGVLSDEEVSEYRKLLFYLAARIDNDVIMQQEYLSLERKIYLISRKQKADTVQALCRADIRNVLGEFKTVICFIHMKKRVLSIEGFQICPAWDLDKPDVFIGITPKTAIRAQRVPYVENIYSADMQVAAKYFFRAEIRDEYLKGKKDAVLSIYTEYGTLRVKQRNVTTGRYAPVSSRLDKSWCIEGEYLIRPGKEGLRLTHIGKHHLLTSIKCEAAFLSQIAGENMTGAKKALVSRCLYHVLYPFVPKNIWLITDKADRADDNGEAFYKYLLSMGKKAGCIPVFAVGKNSHDYKRIKKMGLVVPYLSWRHKMLHLFAEHTISAYSHEEISSPFRNYSWFYGDILTRNKVIFLQHGITHNDVSAALNRYQKNFALFVTAAQREWESIALGNYGYLSGQVILTGFPRYDLLYSDTKKIITVMPTWDRKLCGRFIAEESRWELLPGFEESEYFRFYTDLLTDQRLLSKAEECGYRIRFLPHPVFLPYVDLFKVDRRVEVLHANVSYRKVFAESALITTDYSSVAFDFAYLKKPVVYSQFRELHYAQGYFNYETDGFGEVEHTVDATVKRLIEYMENDCRLKEKYAGRIDSFFKFHDRKNCERIYLEIKKLDLQK